MKQQRIAVFDLETTGTDVERDRIVEFAFVELDGELAEKACWHERVNPGRPIPLEAAAVHGISDNDVADCPAFSRFAPRIQALVDAAILVAHHHQFDVNMLHYELVRAGQAGIPVDHPCIDTLLIERFVNSHRLGPTLERYTGLFPTGWHGAVADAEAAAELLRRQIASHPDKIGHEVRALTQDVVEKRIRDEIVFPFAKDPEFLKKFEPRWLDRGRRFYCDAEGTVRFGFGKHRDQATLDHHSYLEWILTSEMPVDAKRVAKRLLDGDAIEPP